jgi:hypothetical protein
MMPRNTAERSTAKAAQLRLLSGVTPVQDFAALNCANSGALNTPW